MGNVLEQRDLRGATDLPLLGVSVAYGVTERTADDGRPAPSLDLSGYKVVAADDIVMNALGKPHGSIGRSPIAGITSPAYWVLRCREGLDPRFAHHLLRSHWAVARFAGLGKNLPPNQFDITWETFRTIEVRLPGAEEQRRIADFLDDRVARIDQIITARLAQCTALEDAYTAWLSDFVEGLGPRHGWAPLRRFDVSIEQGWSPEADSVPALPGEPGVLKLGAVRGGMFVTEQNKAFLEGVTPREEWRILQGDLLVTRANTPSLVGDVAVAEDTGAALYLSDLIYRLRTTRYGSSMASAALRSPRIRQLIAVIARGTSGSMPKLRGEDILALPVPTIPLRDHDRLGQEDKLHRQERDLRISQLRHGAELLGQYKQSLITAAVTGELDVTTAGSGIPG